ncbi:MAG: nucleotidyltransferase family protein, partial [Bacillota bacterium]|nr:nucleotidyltransferase family protein [Bacillota bacterium]
MNIIGIISEYNPFHAGHLHHIAETKKRFPDSIIVAVMSGNFVQRGEAAVLNKWDRAEIAVKNGVNLVVELPTYYAVSAAPDFAKGAMDVLGQLHATHFSFGSEIDSPDALSALSDFTGTEAYNKKVKEGLAKGLSYPAATAAAGGPILPNALLATEYLKHANGICPILIPRASNHSSLELHACASQENAPRDLPYPAKDTAEVPVYSSAKAIRHALSGSEKTSVLSAEKKLTELTGVNYIGLRSHRPQPDMRHLDSDRFPSS